MSKAHDVPKLSDKEAKDDYERRTWRERLHYDRKKGEVFIPPMMLKNCLSGAAKYLSMRVPGSGKATFTKHFEAGVLVQDLLFLGIKKDDVEGETLFVPSDGKRGGGSRVMKTFPIIHEWSGEAVFYILDETITKEVFLYHLEEAGKFMGLGRFRPRNNGYYGRFSVKSLSWAAE